MDFYDSIFQYDLEVQNKLTERLNTFFKSINLLKNESLINHPNNTESKYKHIHDIINEMNSSNKFKSKLLLNQKKQLLLRMNNKNKNKLNSKYYIYAKDMNKDNQKMDIIEIENSLNKKESNIDKFKQQLELEKCFNQKTIYYDEHNITEEKKDLIKLQSDIYKIVCDIIKQNVKNIYNQKLNEICLNNNKGKKIENNNNNNINIKNNNYIKIDLPIKEIYFQEFKQGKDNKKIHNNHSTEKNANYINYFKDNNNNTIKKELRNSVANNNINHLKIKVNKNDILNFNNLNNNNINNLLLNKIKNLKNDNNNAVNNIQSNKIAEKENAMKEIEKEKEKRKNENEDNNHKNKKKMNNKNNSEKNYNDKNNNNDNKNGEQNHKKMIIRNIQRIQIKNIKLKNNPTGYNLTNICKKKLEDFENSEKNNLKKSKQKNRQCSSPGDVALSNKKINILKFKLGKNDPTSVRKNTEKKNDVDNINVNDNSILSVINDKMKDIYSHGIRFSSVKKKKIADEISINDLSQISDSKKVNNNFLIRNYKTNINRNNNNLNNKNSFTKESEYDNEKYLMINRNNNIRKSLSKESGSNSYLPWKVDNANAIVNKSNNKGNMIDSYLNHAFKIDNKNNFDVNLKNIKEYKNRNKKSNNTHYIYNDNVLKKNENNNKIYEQNYENDQMKIRNTKYKKNKSIYNANNNFKENKQLVDAGYNDTINNKDEPISYREGIKIKGKRRILSTRVHIRGVNSSKNFNNILGKNV